MDCQIKGLMQAVKSLSFEEIEILRQLAEEWAKKKKAVRQTAFFMCSSNRDMTRPASNILPFPLSSARRK